MLISVCTKRCVWIPVLSALQRFTPHTRRHYAAGPRPVRAASRRGVAAPLQAADAPWRRGGMVRAQEERVHEAPRYAVHERDEDEEQRVQEVVVGSWARRAAHPRPALVTSPARPALHHPGTGPPRAGQSRRSLAGCPVSDAVVMCRGEIAASDIRVSHQQR